MSTQIVHITFPELKFHPSIGHKLRGYFGNLFREHSPLLHNHLEDGTFVFRYPLVQYKVINKTPYLVGLGEGAELLASLFLQVKELRLEGKNYLLHTKKIQSLLWQPKVGQDLYSYDFRTLWMALNRKNYLVYLRENETDRKQHLTGILIGNILSFLKGINVHLRPDQRLLAQLRIDQHQTQFKDQKMLAFSGQFTANILLPDFIGLGKAVSRGYGAIQRVA